MKPRSNVRAGKPIAARSSDAGRKAPGKERLQELSFDPTNIEYIRIVVKGKGVIVGPPRPIPPHKISIVFEVDG